MRPERFSYDFLSRKCIPLAISPSWNEPIGTFPVAESIGFHRSKNGYIREYCLLRVQRNHFFNNTRARITNADVTRGYMKFHLLEFSRHSLRR